MITSERLAQIAAELSSSENPPATVIESRAMARELASRREQDRWIPVGERLPDVDGAYLCVLDYGDQKHVDVRAFIVGRFGTNHGLVTHWRPLPSPDQDEGRG